jgi:uncharacterized membrane-anchored protein
LVIAVVTVQLAVLAYMAGEREWVLRTGQSVLLRTAPIDPRDPMRGDYVRLSYEAATVPKKLCRDTVLTWFADKNFNYDRSLRDRRVYAAIKLDRDGVAEVLSLSDRLPNEGLYLRARVQSVSRNTIQIRFGVEALFMQQGEARKFEDLQRGEKQGVPLNMEVAVNSRGLATIKGYRWEPLGITLVLDRPPAPPHPSPQTPRPGLRGATVQLKNHSDQPVAILAGDEARFLRLIPAREFVGGDEPLAWEWAQEATTVPKPRPEEIKLLQPGETHEFHLDFASPQWFVRKGANGTPTSLTSLTQEWSASFRVEYEPPSAEACAGLPHAEQIRHARLRSRRFTAAGGGD